MGIRQIRSRVRLIRPWPLLGLIFLAAVTTALISAFDRSRLIDEISSQVEANGGFVWSENPDWMARCPDFIKRRITIFKRITDLRTPIADDEFLSQLSSCDKLRKLSLAEHAAPCDVTDEGLRHLQNLTNLEFVAIHAPGVTDKGLQYFSNMHELEWLDLRFCELRGTGFQYLREMQKLQFLQLQNTPTVDDHLDQLIDCRKLAYLYLDHTLLTDRGLSQLSAMHWIRILSLEGTQVSDRGLRHLMAMNKLGDLNLAATSVTAAGVAELMRDIDGVGSLDLSRTNLDDNQAKYLHALPTILWMSVKDSGISPLAAAEIRRSKRDMYLAF